MRYEVRWLKQAAEDLQSIREYLDQEAPCQAREIVNLLYDSAMALKNFPNGRGQREPERPAYRRLIILKIYKVIYRVNESQKTVEIRHIRHTSQGEMSLYED